MSGISATSLTTLAASGIALFNQDSRLLSLRFAEASGLGDETLLPHRLQGEESLSQSYCYRLDCLSADMHLELKELIGQPVEISLLLPDGGARLLTGLVTRAEQHGADGGFARYTLTIEPALATLAHRRNSRVFQDQSVPAIVATLLDEHLAANPAFTHSFAYQNRLEQTYPERSYTLQYRETDLAFIERLLAEEGISYHYSHGPDPDTSLQDSQASPADATPLHTLILFDSPPALDAHDRGTIRFHRTDGVEGEDSIDTWHGSRQLSSQRTTLASYDYQAVATHHASDDSRTRHGDSGEALHSNLEDYDPQTGYYGSDPDDMARYTTLRQQAQDLAQKTFSGEGSRRDLTPGSHFALADHPIHDQDNPEDRQFLVTRHTFEAENNLTPDAQSQLAGLLGNDEADDGGQNRPPYRNRFDAIRKSIPVVPAYSQSQHQKPTAHGLTTATVVGPADEEIFTDEHGRIKIQFHWQRPIDHPNGGADQDDHSSTWVRVAMPSAGAAWGSQYIPRIGQEVVIDFIEGDIDRPLITGVVYNGSHRPPTFSGAGSLPANKTLSGHKSKEYKGSRYNQLLFDDSTGEIRTQLASEHGKTQLNQGYLIHPRTDGKGEARGEGFELRTDQHGVLRAQGLLLTSWQKLNAAGKQLSRDETLGLMDQCLELFKQLGDYAAQHEGNPIDPQPHEKLNQAFKDWENGTNTSPEGSNGKAPVIGLTAPGGIHQSTPENHVSYAGKNLDQVAQQNLQQTAGQHYTLNTGKSIALFAHDEGLKAIAHHGKLLLQSQHDDTVVNAEQNVKVTASQGKIVCMADKEILWINGGGAYVKLSGGDIEIGCPGSFTAKAAKHNLFGPGSMSPNLSKFTEGVLPPLSTFGRTAQFQIGALPGDLGSMYANEPYKIYRNGSLYAKGLTDSNGLIQVPHVDGTSQYTVELATGQQFELPVSAEWSEDQDIGEEQRLSLDGHREIASLDDHPHAGRKLFEPS